MHFTRMSGYADGHVPVIVRGEGAYVWDDSGKRYLDGLAGLFTVQVGHGRRELVEAAAHQAVQLAYFPLWSYAHPAAIELAERLADYAPGDINGSSSPPAVVRPWRAPGSWPSRKSGNR
jgi:adenosylmethionine-8-amino-7-oxononanoate aminotransferase